jgi:tetratricopeptide (TPR) repeat protein
MRLPLTSIRLIPVTLLFFHSCSPPERPVTNEEAAFLARRIEAAAVRRNDLVIDNVFDDQSFGKRVATEAGKPLDKDLVRGAIKGIHDSHFGRKIMQSLGKTGTYLLVKQYEKDKRQHLLFRIYGDAGLNYHDYELVKLEDQVKAVDIYVYLTGENLTKTIAEAVLAMQGNTPDKSNEDLQKTESLKEIRSLLAQGDTKEAAEIFDKLPKELKRQKLFELVHIQIAQKMSDSAYSQALDEYGALFPNDPNMHLIMIDSYIMHENYPKALEAVNKLDSLIDKDPFLDYYRGILYKMMKDSAQSRICLERLHKYMPGFGDGTVVLIAGYAESGDLDKATALIRQARKDASVSDEKLEALCTLHPNLKTAMQAGK